MREPEKLSHNHVGGVGWCRTGCPIWEQEALEEAWETYRLRKDIEARVERLTTTDRETWTALKKLQRNHPNDSPRLRR